MDTTNLTSKSCAKRCLTAAAIAAVIFSTLFVLQPYVSTQTRSFVDATGLSPSLPSTANLTLVNINGAKLALNSSQIANLPSTMASGGYKPQGASPPFSTNNYTGVSFNTLANLIGGVNSSELLMVEGSDGYSMNFTYSQVNGNFTTYDRTTGLQTSPTKPIIPIIAYYNNSEIIPAGPSGGRGPLMVAIVGNESLITSGKYWLSWVVKLEVFPVTQVPELPPVSLFVLFIALTLIAVASSVYVGRKSPRKLPFHED